MSSKDVFIVAPLGADQNTLDRLEREQQESSDLLTECLIYRLNQARAIEMLGNLRDEPIFSPNATSYEDLRNRNDLPMKTHIEVARELIHAMGLIFQVRRTIADIPKQEQIFFEPTELPTPMQFDGYYWQIWQIHYGESEAKILDKVTISDEPTGNQTLRFTTSRRLIAEVSGEDRDLVGAFYTFIRNILDQLLTVVCNSVIDTESRFDVLERIRKLKQTTDSTKLFVDGPAMNLSDVLINQADFIVNELAKLTEKN